LCIATESPEEHRRGLWRMMAFAARYGHTDPSIALHMPVPDLFIFVEELGRLIEEEAEAARKGTDS